MGCNNSKLAGEDEFRNIDATLNQGMHWRSNKPSSDPTKSSAGQESYSQTTPNISPGEDEEPLQKTHSPSFGSHAYMGTLPFTGKSNESKSHGETDNHDDPQPKSKKTKMKKPLIEIPNPYAGALGIDGPGPSTRRMFLDGKELTSSKHKSVSEAPQKNERNTSFSTGDNERKPVLRTDQDRMQADPVTGKKPGMYQRWTNKRLGVGEERDPVTGRGKLTGMTKEETIEYVERTRGAGMYSGKQYTFVGPNEGGGWAG